MLIALLTMAFTITLIPISPYFVLLLVIMFFFGISQGMIDVGGNVNLLWVFQGRVGPYMNALHFCFGVGAFLSPIILHNVMRWSGGQITWPFWTLALLSLPGILGLWSLSSPYNPEKDEIEQNPNSINVRLVVLMVLLFFIYVGIEGGFGGWIFTYATEANIASETGASYMNSIFWGALTLGRLLSVPLARKIAPSRLLVGNFLLGYFLPRLDPALPIQSRNGMDCVCGFRIGFIIRVPNLVGLRGIPHENIW
jgi:MFS transporter, FHS family, Na+ dependent glucose transporter 1